MEHMEPYTTRLSEHQMRWWHMSSEIARRRLAKIDADRRAFIHNHFKKDVNDPSYYTLVINTDHVSVDQAVGSIMAMLHPE